MPACGHTSRHNHVRTEQTFRGYLLLCFMATAVIKVMSDILAKSRISLTAEPILEILHEQRAVEYDGQLVATGSMRKMNEAYRAFDIKRPDTVDLPVVGYGSVGDSGLMN